MDKRLSVRMASVAVVLALVGCGGGGGNSDPPAAPPPAPTVGADGGVVSGVAGVTVVVPPGALNEPATIRVANDSTGAPAIPAWFSPAGPMVAITPHGATFSEPVTVRLPAPNVTLQDNERLLIAKAQPGGQWEVFSDTALKDGQLEVKVTSFSVFVPVVVSAISSGLPGQFALSPIVLDCDGAPCAAVERFRPMTITATTRVAGGQLPPNCGNPEVALLVGDPVIFEAGPRIPATTASVLQWSFQMPLASLTLIRHGSVGVGARLVCADPVTGAASYVNLGGALFAVDTFPTERTTPTVRQFPAAVTQAAGDVATLRAVLSGGASYRVGTVDPSFNAPTVADQATVYLERLLPGDTAWRILATSLQTDANSNPLGSKSWMYWSFDYSTGPLTLADNGTGYRIRACYRAPGEPLVACNVGPTATQFVVQQTQQSVFTQQPRSVLIQPGQTASFSTQVGGTPAPALQWQLRSSAPGSNWVDVAANGNAANYTTQPISLADNGIQYRLLASNSAGSTASEIVTVSVSATLVPPAITSQPMSIAVVQGSEAVFAVHAAGTEALSYQWFNGKRALKGANAPQLKLAAVTDADGGAYSVEISNAAGAVTSAAAQLTVTTAAPVVVAPAIVTQPAAVAVTEGNVATFAVGVNGSGPMSFQWHKNGVDIAGATAAAYTLPAVAMADGGNYSVRVGNSAGTLTSQAATLAVAPANVQATPTAPTIVNHQGSIVVAPGMSAMFGVGVQGSGPIAYQWLHNGVPVPGRTSAIYAIGAASALDAGSYQVQVGNSAGSVTSAVSQVILLGAPVITAQPVATSALVGGQPVFKVSASGDYPRYQWLRNNIAIAGADSASYTTPALTLADSGAVYGVIVYNGAGLVFSQGAVLTVTPAAIAPTITHQPPDIFQVEDLAINIEIALAGTPPFEFRVERFVGGNWITQPGSGSLPDNRQYIIGSGSLALADNGSQFRVVASNAAGSVTTRVISVTVIAASQVGMALWAGDFTAGGGAVNGTGTAARFDSPEGLVADGTGNLYVAQSNGSRVAKIDSNAAVMTLASHASAATLALGPDGSLYSLQLSSNCMHLRILPPLNAGASTSPWTCTNPTAAGSPRGIAVDASGVVHIGWEDGNSITRVGAQGGDGSYPLSVFVGAENRFVAAGYVDGIGTAARFSAPRSIAFGPNGDLFVADSANHVIRRVTPQGLVSTFAGNTGQRGSSDGTGTSARFTNPTDLSFDSAGNLWVLERGDLASIPVAYVRRINPGAVVNTMFNASAESVALAGAGQEAFARNIRGMAVLSPHRIALSAGNAILVRTLP